MNQKLKKLIIIILAIILLIAGYFVLFQKPETAAADWWDDSWLYRQTVAITNSGTAETDFQVMITLDTTTLVTANKIQSDCDDIRVTDINGKLIPHWIEPTTCNTSATKIWTKVPSISTSGDTVYLYYGNSAVNSISSTTDTFIREISGVQGAWDMDGSGAIATNDTLADSSGNTNTGTAFNVNTTGMAYASSQFGQGVDFDGSDDYVDCGNDASLDPTTFSVEVWVYPESTSVSGAGVVSHEYPGGANEQKGFRFLMFTDMEWRVDDDTGTGKTLTASSPLNTWTHWVGTFSSSYVMTLYKNGVFNSSRQLTGYTPYTNGKTWIGSGYASGLWPFHGDIDQVRIYNTALSSNEITDLYGTGGDRQGYVTTNYPNKSLVRKYSETITIDPPTGEERGPGPVAFWKFDEGFGQTANDSTINANNGTLGATSGVESSDPTWQTEDMCVSGKCLKFDGVDDYVDGGYGSSLDMSSAYTLSAWIKNSDSTGDDRMILAKATSLGNRNFQFRIDNATGLLRLIRFNSSDSIITNFTSSKIVDDNYWHYVVAVFDNTVGSKIYIDGELDGSDTVLTDNNTETEKLLIGARNSTSLANHFNGSIDSVKIYPYARTAAQIKADYASRGTASGVSAAIGDDGKKSLSDGLVGYWKMDEASWNGTADEVVDSSGAGNHGVRVDNATTGAGKFGNGGVFDGTGDYVTVTDDDSLDITDAITVSAWVNPTTIKEYPVGNPTYTAGGSSPFEVSPENTLVEDDSWGNFGGTDSNYEGAYTGNWVWDFGNSKNRTLHITWQARGEKITYWQTTNFIVEASPDLNSWTTIRSFGYSDTTTSPIYNDDIFGNYRYLRARWRTGYSHTGKCTIYVDGVWSEVPVLSKSESYSIGASTTEAFGYINDQSISASTSSGWQYITMSYNGSSQKLYVNGILQTEQALTGAINTNTENLIIGGTYLNGSIDEVRIYNRALSPGEVRDLYNFAPGPVGWWKMDEKVLGDGQTINDVSGYGNTGTTFSANGTGMDCMVPGKYGSACEFDGVDDYVNAGNDASLNITEAITVEGWIKPTVININQKMIGSRAGGNKYILGLSDSGTSYVELWTTGGGPYISTLGSFISGNWHHYSMTYLPSDGYYIVYLNGVDIQHVNTDSNNMVSNNGNVQVGASGVSSNLFNGSIDDVRIYNYARTPSQIMEDYSAGAGRKQPIGHWKFDEGYGTTANNSGIGGSALNGTLTNMASPATSASGWTDEGKIGKGLVFDGGNDYVDVADNAALDITGKKVSLEAWIKVTGQSGNAAQRILRIGDQITFGCSDLTTLRLGGWVYDGGWDGSWIESNFVLNYNEWYHVVMVWDESYRKYYVNGENVKNVAFSGAIDGASGNTKIGIYGTLPFNGSIDDVKIYNYALTEDEIRKEYNQGALLKLGSTGTDSSGNADDSQSREYCIPGDTSTCNPPVGRWDFNEGAGSTVNDISGNNNTGTWSGAGSHWTTGKIGKGGSFNGDDDYVNCGNNSSLNITDAITIDLWMKQSVSGTFGTLVGRSGWFQWVWIQAKDSDKTINVNIEDVVGYTTFKTQSDAYEIDKWNHIVVTYDKDGGSDNANIYVNGIVAKTLTLTGSIGTTSVDLRIGNTSTTYSFKGSIDQVRIYDYARTPAQVAWDYNRGKPVAHWKFDECQGGTAYDSSRNGNDGTITIGATVPQTVLGTCETPTDGTGAWYNGRSGKYNSSMSFDGSDDWVEVADNSSLDITDAITIEAWVKPINFGGGSYGRIVDKTYTTGYAFHLDDIHLSNGLKFVSQNTGVEQISDADIIVLNVWQHVVVTYDKQNVKFYVDGAYKGGGAETASLGTNTDELVIGNRLAADRSFDGLIDEVKIYNYALTPLQVKNAYNDGAVRFR